MLFNKSNKTLITDPVITFPLQQFSISKFLFLLSNQFLVVYTTVNCCRKIARDMRTKLVLLYYSLQIFHLEINREDRSFYVDNFIQASKISIVIRTKLNNYVTIQTRIKKQCRNKISILFVVLTSNCSWIV